MIPLARRARRACPLAHRRGAKRCISCTTIEGEMLHMLQRIERAADRKSTKRAEYLGNRVYFTASLTDHDLRDILRSEGLTEPRRMAKK